MSLIWGKKIKKIEMNNAQNKGHRNLQQNYNEYAYTLIITYT